jgi:hypothetical protein
MSPIPVPIVDTPTFITLSHAQIRGKRTATGAIEASVGGAVTETEMNTKIYPALARWSTAVINGQVQTILDEATIDLMKTIIDLDRDGEITSDEWKQSLLIAGLQLDLDTNGDGKPDAFSAGAGGTFVPCNIDRGRSVR